MDYTTLVAAKTTEGSIKDWANYSRIPSTQILTEAEAFIYARIRSSEMLVIDTAVSIAQDATYIAKPAGWQSSLIFSIPQYMPRVRFIDPGRFYAKLALDTTGAYPSGTPTYYSMFNGRFNFNTKADQAYTAHHIYYKSLDALSGSNEQNFLTDDHPTLLRRTCLMLCAEYRKDWKARDRYERDVLRLINDVNIEHDEELATMELDFHWTENAR